MLSNTTSEYGSISKFFHWLIAALVILMLLIGILLDDFPKSLQPAVYTLHKSTGLTIMILMVIRLFWTIINPSPKLPINTPAWQRILSHSVHGLLYLGIILMPISGFLMSSAAGKTTHFWWLVDIRAPITPDKALATLFSDIHTILAWIISALIALHLAAAIKHYIIDKDGVLERMLP